MKRFKYKCVKKESDSDGTISVWLEPILQESIENCRLYEKLSLWSENPDELKQFEVGKEYNVDISLVE